MDAAIYARLSSDRAGLSLNTTIQRREAHSYAQEHGWKVVSERVDDDTSASRYTTKPRPGYQALLSDIRSGRVEVVLCTEMSRLYRRIEELLELIRLAETTRLKRIETTDGLAYDLSTGVGIYNAVNAVNSAVLESRRISDRVKRKKAAIAQEGRPGGGVRPYGYEPDGVTLRTDEVTVVRECVDRLLAGDTISAITRNLNQRGVKTAQGNEWRMENLKRLLESERYRGIRVHNGVEYPAIWPALVTTDEFARMKAIERRRQAQPIRPKGVRSYLLTGFAYCGECGTPMVGNAHKRGNTTARRYRCMQMDTRGNKRGCGKVFRMAEPLEAFVSEALLYRLDSPEVAKALMAQDDRSEEIDHLMAEFEARKAKVDELVADYASGLLSRSQFAFAKGVAERVLLDVTDQLDRYQEASTVAAIPVGQSIRETWERESLDWRRQLISLVVERIIVKRGHPGMETWNGFRFSPRFVEVTWRA